MRLACQNAIESWQAGPEQNTPQKLLAVRSIQEQISIIKNRNPAAGARAALLGWVDDWNPPAL